MMKLSHEALANLRLECFKATYGTPNQTDERHYERAVILVAWCLQDEPPEQGPE